MDRDRRFLNRVGAQALVGSALTMFILGSAATVIGVGCFGLANPASAQQTWGQDNDDDDQDEAQPPILPAEIDDMSRTLGLNQGQDEIIAALYDGYAAAYRDNAESMQARRREMFEQARENGDFRSMGESMRTLMAEQATAADQLEANFFESVQAMLTPEQQSRWSSYERLHRRRGRMQGISIFAGENVDVIELVNSLEIDTLPDATTATLASYASEIDALLLERERVESQIRDLDWMNEEETQKLDDLAERVISNRRRLRSLNFETAETIAAQVGGDGASLLRAEYARRAHPAIYRETPAEEYIARAIDIESLTPEQVSSIEAAEAGFAAEVAEINRRLASLNEEAEQAAFTDEGLASNPWMRRTMAMRTGGRDGRRTSRWLEVEPASILMSDELNEKRSELMARKRALIVDTVARVHASLSPDQQAIAPQPEIPEQSETERRRERIRGFMTGAGRGEWSRGDRRRENDDRSRRDRDDERRSDG